MASFDQFVIGFSIFWLLMPLVALAIRSLRRESKQSFSATFWISWGNVLGMNMIALISHNHGFYHAYQPLILAVFFLWLAVLLWNFSRTIKQGMQKEIDEGRAPQISNDWAKPDKL